MTTAKSPGALAAPRRLRAQIAVVALLAAASGWALHHVTVLSGHALELVVVVLLLAVLTAAIPAWVWVGRRPELPVIVALRGPPDVRHATRDDMDFAAALHADGMQHGFFTALGHRFLRVYHDAYRASPHALALVATVNGHPVGVLAGVLRPAAHRRWVLRHRGLRLAASGTIALLARPVTSARFVRTRAVRYGRAWRRARGAGAVANDTARTPAQLSHIVVSRGARGAGVGVRLVGAFTEAARADGAEHAVLATLHGPDGAAVFYRRLGWRESHHDRTSDAAAMVLMRKDLRDPT